LLLPTPLIAQPVEKEPLVQQVKRAIDRGVQFLRQKQRPGGSYEVDLVKEGGQTALAVIALLNAGVPYDDPAVRGGLQYLRELKSEYTYIRALQAIAFAEAKRPEDLPRIRDHVNWLIAARVRNDGKLLGWNYDNKSPATADGSNTQYALLGLWAGKLAGIRIDDAIWQEVRQHYLQFQSPKDGSWTYQERNTLVDFGGPQLTMTTAGISGLLIAGSELNERRETFRDKTDKAEGCGVYAENEALEKGMSWIKNHFSIQVLNPARTYYSLYGLERTGRLTGQRFFGEYDWYREGSKFLIRQQHADGSWHDDSPRGSWDKWPIVSTSFALLFLSKGKTPVLMSKMVHGAWPRRDMDLDWNNDRNDLRHLVNHASKEIFKRQPLAWQTVDLMVAALPGRREVATEEDLQLVTSDLLQSPILYITGHQSPSARMTAIEKNLLKRYVDNGGFILAEACCSSPAFDVGFKRLVAEIWPDQDLEELPGDHPVWSNPAPVAPGKPYKLFGLNQGCKTVLIYSPFDLSCRWETGKADDPRCVEAFRLGLNIIAYATGMQPPQPRLTQVTVVSDRPDPPQIPRGFIKVAQLKTGSDKPAPRAMRYLMEHLHEVAGLNVVLKTEDVTWNYKNIADFKFLYMHGRESFRFVKDDLKQLHFNLTHGGLLFADACCGKEPFDKSFREFVAALFPEHKLEQVPLNDPLFSSGVSGETLSESTIRCRLAVGGDFKNAPPFLEGIRHEGRWVVLYSKYDIGCALEKHQSPDCRGYDPASALKIARAAALYALLP
jgi:hypothetical protein